MIEQDLQPTPDGSPAGYGVLRRRQLLTLAGVVVGSVAATSLLAACGTAAPAPPTAAPVPPTAVPVLPTAVPVPPTAAPAPAAPTAAPAATSGTTVKAAFLYLSAANDHGYAESHENGRKALVQAMGAQVETAVSENLPEGPDAQRAMEDYARKGFSVIYGTSFGYMDSMLAVANSFPNVKFEHATGYKTAANLATYSAAQEDARYAGGIIAGKMTRSNVLGFIGSFPIPGVIADLNAWALGARSVNPQVKVRMVWINTWFDPAKEKAAADSLIDLGADVLSSVTDSPAMAQAAAARKAYAQGSNADQSSYAPDAVLTSAVFDWSQHYVTSVRSILNGTWQADQTYYHLKDGAVKLVKAGAMVPPDVAKLATDAVDRLMAGTLQVWQGPITDNQGNVVIPEGKTLGDIYAGPPPAAGHPGQTRSDAYVLGGKMNWAASNVEGTLPSP